MVTRAIERAQKQVEAQNFEVRKHLLEYDDVMNKQRESIYALRRELLEGQVRIDEDETVDTRGYVMSLAEDLLDDIVDRHIGRETDVEAWDVPAFKQEITRVFGFAQEDFAGIDFGGSTDEIEDATVDAHQGGVPGEGGAASAASCCSASSATSCCRSWTGSGRTISTASTTSKRGSACAATVSVIRSSSTSARASNCSRRCAPASTRTSSGTCGGSAPCLRSEQADAPAHQPSAPRRSQPLILNEPNEQAADARQGARPR